MSNWIGVYGKVIDQSDDDNNDPKAKEPIACTAHIDPLEHNHYATLQTSSRKQSSAWLPSVSIESRTKAVNHLLTMVIEDGVCDSTNYLTRVAIGVRYPFTILYCAQRIPEEKTYHDAS